MDEVNKKLPNSQLGMLGLQHVLVLYFSSISVPLTVGKALGMSTAQLAYLVSASCVCAGIATLLQSIGLFGKAGLSMPAMQGVTVMAATALTAIATEYDIQTVFGAVIASGIVCILLAPVFSKLTKLFPPLVRGLIVAVTGLTLVPVATGWMTGVAGTDNFGLPDNYLLTLVVIVVILILHKFTDGFIKNIAPLIGLAVGLLLAMILGKVNFTEVSTASWIGFTTPFYFGIPKFALSPMISLSIVMIVIMGESIALYMALNEICEVPTTNEGITRGLLGNGISVVISGILNSFLFTTFTQNVGMVAFTKVKSRYSTIAGGIILVILGLIPKLGTIVALIPNAVLGGVGIFVFTSIVVSGIKTCSPELAKGHNSTIATLTIGVGLGCKIISMSKGFAAFNATVAIFLNDGIIMGTIVAVLLNLYFNGLRQQE